MYDSRSQQQQRTVSPSNGSMIEHSIMEDDDSPTTGGTFHDSDSELEDSGMLEDDMIDDDDASSSLSIPNESIDFDLVYALHSFAATVEGQANVVKGDSLFLMDDSNSYWWLVRVLKTQEVGYIPAENIETPFERLARLNKHRNVDLAHPTNEEKQGSGHAATINAASPIPRPLTRTRSVVFHNQDSYHHYPPAVWNEDEHIPDDSEYGDEIEEEYESGQEGEHEEEDWDIDDYQQHHSDDEPQKPEPINELSQARPSTQLDPAHAPDVQRKVSITPAIAREQMQQQQQQEQQQQHQRTLSNASSSSGHGVQAPSSIQRQEEERARKAREEEAEARSKATVSATAAPSPAKSTASPGKLRKERSDDEESSSSKKKKTSSVFGGLFGRKKEKNLKDNSSKGSVSSDADSMRTSEDSTATRRPESVASPVTAQAIQQQQQSPHSALSSQLRRQDQEQQARYTQTYLTNKSSPTSLQPSYGLQSAPSIMQTPSSNLTPPAAGRPRPTSLILSPSHADSADLPDLSVLRIFAGEHLDTDATFKTVLLNSSTTSSDLIKQAMQRFRLPAGENPADYYLQVKQVEGGKSADLRDDEHPLEVFESLVVMMEHEREEEEMMMSMLPKVKRSSIASISSVASNLSMHPAIRKLAMNDFSDDSAVKFYLNRRHPNGDREYGEEGEETLIAADTSVDQGQYLTVTTPGGANVSPERFSSPSFRFALQLIIYADDIPDNMVFDPLTEAIVFKDSTYRTSTSSTNSSVGQNMRRKVFLFPRNVTVAEVIELGLERFGIAEGVVDGGDEVEDKGGSLGSKRRSMASYRVRYTLTVDDGEMPERELGPSSKVIEAFGTRQPSYKIAESNSTRRRSIDSAQLLSHHSMASGSEDFIGPDDPVFILRRAISYKSHRRVSSSSNAPLDELALHQTQTGSGSGAGGSSKAIIQAQRRARRDNQQAILSAQTNNSRGLDVLLPGNAMLRSSRYEDRPNAAERYSYAYVHPDGESYDVSEIVQEEYAGDGDDFLEGVKNTNGSGGTLQRVLSKIQQQRPAKSTTPTPSGQHAPTMSRATTQQSYHTAMSSSPSPMASSSDDDDDDDGVNSRSITPTANGKTTPRPMVTARQPSSISSVMSYATAPSPSSPHPAVPQRKLFLTDDDFGVSTMLSIIEYKANKRPVHSREEEEDIVDKMFFGSPIPKDLHPKVQEVYKSGFNILDEMDNCLDEWLDGSSRQRASSR